MFALLKLVPFRIYAIIALVISLVGCLIYHKVEIHKFEKIVIELNKTIEQDTLSIKNLKDAIILANSALDQAKKDSEVASEMASKALEKATKETMKARLDAKKLSQQKSSGDFVKDCKLFEININNELGVIK